MSRLDASGRGLFCLVVLATSCATVSGDSQGNPLPPLLPVNITAQEQAAAKTVVISFSPPKSACRRLGRAGGRDGIENEEATGLQEGDQTRARLALQLQVHALGGNFVAVDYVDRPHHETLVIGGAYSGAIDWPYWVLRGTAYDCSPAP